MFFVNIYTYRHIDFFNVDDIVGTLPEIYVEINGYRLCLTLPNFNVFVNIYTYRHIDFFNVDDIVGTLPEIYVEINGYCLFLTFT
jgi:hypothetical protein